MTNSVKYSVVIPTYNSAFFIADTVNQIGVELNKTGAPFEIVIIDDSSIDNTWNEIKRLKAETNYNIQGARLARNFGQHRSTLCGFEKAKGELIITMDDDLESNPKKIQDLLNKQSATDSDVVYAHYTNIRRGIIRTFMFWVYRIFAKAAEGQDRVNGSSFRVVKKWLAKRAIQNASSFAFIDELFVWNTDKIQFVDIKHQIGLRGKSNYSTMNLVNTSTQVMLVGSDVPLRVIKFIGLSMAGVNFLIGFFYIVRKLMGKISEMGYASTIVSILFSTGLILFAIAIIGEYLHKVFRAVQNVPLYALDEEL